MLKKYYSSIIVIISLSFSLAGQTTAKKNDPYSNPVILKHYSVSELQQIEASDSVKFNSIIYYYTQSFIIEKVDCPTCEEELDINKFDISKYEYLRKKSERFTRHAEKYGVIITLLSIDELIYKLPIHIAN
ncbi:MAG: hypothetical protein JNL24_02245 [Bacteroidia bacterium]|nr:hypothetical protein [Bacteroidia bacterium]